MDKDGREVMHVQMAFIQYFARKLEKFLPECTHGECVMKIVEFTGAGFREWVKGLTSVETVQDFLLDYGPPEGPERIFSELFPNQSIEDFLRSCLNGDESDPVSVGSEEVHEQAMNSIK